MSITILVLVLHEGLGRLEIGLYHLLDQRVEVDLALPAKQTLSLLGVPMQEPVKSSFGLSRKNKIYRKDLLDLRGTEVAGVDFDHDFPGSSIVSFFVDSSPFPSDPTSRNEFEIWYLEDRTYLISMSSSAKAFSTNSRTGCVSPVARTKSSGVGCCNMRHMPST